MPTRKGRTKTMGNNAKKGTAPVPSLRQIRMWELDTMVQDQLNEPYLDIVHMATKALRFNPGDTVVSLHDNLFYSATVLYFYEMTAPSSIYPIGTKLPWPMRIPTVMLHFLGWQRKYDTAVPENELLDTTFPKRPVDTLALLVAHEWNLLRRDQLGIKDDKKLGVAAFLMDEEKYKLLETAWQRDSGETSSFGRFCGRKPGPYYSEP